MKKVFLLTAFLMLLPFYELSAQESNYPAGSLLALNEKGAAVYYIGEDGMKYIFSDDKTYFTWYDDFSDVIKVDVNELDKYPDGGVMPYKPSTKLITHSNTANVYAVEPNGVLRRIPSEEMAEKLYGENWGSIVQDVIPGYFSSGYTVKSDLYDKLPTGTLVKEEGKDDIYYIYDGLKRKFANNSFIENNFAAKNILTVSNLSDYDWGRGISEQEDILLNFNKDKLFKYSSFKLFYKLFSQSEMIIQFATSTNGVAIEDRPLEIRKAVVHGQTPMFLRYYTHNYYFDYFSESDYDYREYDDAPIEIDDFNIPLEIQSNSGGVRVDLRDWIIWDTVEDKQIINIHSQTF